MNLTSTKKLFLWCIQCFVVVMLFVYLTITSPVSVNANLTALFADNTNDPWLSIKNKVNASANTTQLYLIGHKDLALAKAAAKAFVGHVEKIKNVGEVVGQLSNIPNQSMMIDSYKGYEQQLLSPKFRNAIQAGDEDTIFKMEFELINQIGDQLVSKTIQSDATLSFAHYLNRSPFPQNKINMTHDGYLTIPHNDNVYILISIQTLKDALNVNSAKFLVSELNKVPLKPDIEYIRTGAIFYSDEASHTAQNEMQLLGGLSILATLLLIFMSYRRISTVVITLSLITISIFYGFVGLSLFFSEVNLLTMVFAITLVGVAVDYSFHSFTELQNIKRDNASPLSKVKVSLVLSFITTTIGYALLFVVPIVLFKQIAIFTIFGLFGALLTVLLVYPSLHKKLNFSRVDSPKLYIAINRIHQSLCYLTPFKILLMGVLFIGLIFSLFQIQFIDNPKTFYRVSEVLSNNEKQVKEILGKKVDNQYLLVKGSTAQELLENEEEILPVLNKLTSQHVMASYQAVTHWLPSVKQQIINNNLLVEASEKEYFSQLSLLLGMDIDTVKVAEKYLLPEEWFQSPIGRSFTRLWHKQDNAFYSVIRFSGINNVDVLSNTLQSINNVEFVDTLADTEIKLATFRQVLFIVFGIAFIAAFFVFTLRYGWKKALIGVLVPATAFSFSIVVSSFIQGHVNLFNVAAGLVILALGLDYSVFYAEHGFSKLITQTTLMSALSSIFVFAMLGFSSTPAIASFGQTVFIGIVITFLCSPFITKILRKRDQDD